MYWFGNKMKRYCVVDCKNWEGKLVHTVSSLNMEYMICETIPENDNDAPNEFKLKSDKDAVIIAIKFWNMTSKVNVKMI